MEHRPALHLRDRARKGVQDQQMRAAIKKAVERLAGNKTKATEDLGNWEQWREQGKRIRKHTVENLDYYLAQFAQNVRKNGGHVHFVQTAGDARQIILDICKKHDAKMVVKSKSMVSEEIHLNPALERNGIAAIETGLAEYIIQLAGEPPSHIIVPAIHKNRRQIAELFSKVAGHPVADDTPSLTAFARNILRDKFLTAKVGITGCNFAVAQTGSVTLVTNEGNARLTTSLPKVLITLMGMERIVPTFEDLEAVLTLLPRSATGQKLTSYTSVINKARNAGEKDGAEEFHILILDNGRSRMLADDEFRQALHCIRCGACFNVCPVYRQIGGHAYASVYGGPIGSVITPFLLNDLDFWGELSFASSLCVACSHACPVKIPLHDLLLAIRHRRAEAGHTPFLEKQAFSLWRRFFKIPSAYKFAMKTAAIAQQPMVHNGFIKAGPPPLSNWTNSRYFPALPGKTFRDRWRAKH